MANYTGRVARIDRFLGTSASDTFRFTAANLDGDTIAGRGGLDTLQITTAGTLGPNALANMSGVEAITLWSGTNAITLLDANYADLTGTRITVYGNSGADSIDASQLTGSNGVDFRSGSGLDTLRGGAGADIFRFAAADLDGDLLVGGGGNDQLVLRTAGALASDALNNVSGIETFLLAPGSNTLTVREANYQDIASGRITIFGNSGSEIINAQTLTSGHALLINSQGGTDYIYGGRGDDIFRFAAADLDSDGVGGGSGFDTLQIFTPGTLTAFMLRGVSGIEKIALAAGTNSLTLPNSLLFGLTVAQLTITGNSGADTIDGSNINFLDVGLRFSTGTGLDVVKGGAGDDIFQFAATSLDGDTIQGGDGTDTLQLTAAGEVTAAELGNMIGVEAITLLTGGISIALGNANFTGVTGGVIAVTGSSGDDTIDGSALSVQHGLRITAGTGNDTLKGGAINDTFAFTGAELATGDTIDGGAGTDTIRFDSDIILLGSTISNTEKLTFVGGKDAAVLISGGNAAGIATFGTDTLDGFAQVYTIQLAAGTTTDLSGLSMMNRDAGDRIDVTSVTGDTAVTLSKHISSFTGGSGNDSVGGIIGNGAVIAGGGGNDRILLNHGASSTSLDGGAGSDTLVLGDGIDRWIDLTMANQIVYSDQEQIDFAGTLNTAINFENIDASAASNDVVLFGRVDLASVLIGGSGNDSLTGGQNGAIITGGLGGDAQIGVSGWTRFRVSSTAEAQGDSYSVSGGTGVIELLGSADLRGTSISGVQRLELAAGTAAGASVTYSETDVTATVTSDQLEALGAVSIAGNGAFSATAETLSVSVERGSANLVDLIFENWGNGDHVLITGSALDDTIQGSGVDDVIYGAGGADIITGNDGIDTFAWASKLDGGDTITDFAAGTDKLGFAAAAFSFSGYAFDTVMVDDGNGGLNLDSVDLLITGTQLEDAAAVRAFIDSQLPTDARGLFVIAASTSGDNVLYYTSDASSDSVGSGRDFHMIANLGTAPVSDTILGDFVFI